MIHIRVVKENTYIVSPGSKKSLIQCVVSSSLDSLHGGQLFFSEWTLRYSMVSV